MAGLQNTPQVSAQKVDAPAALVEAASALMRERDTLDVTLAEISERSGVNSALVKYYFGDKEGLFFAVLEKDFDHSLRALERLLASGLPPEEMLRVHLTGLVEAYSRIPYLNRLVQMMTRDAGSERVRDIVTNFIRPITRAQTRILKSGVAAGVFRRIDPTSFYFQAVGSASCLYSQRFVLDHAFNVSQVSKSLHTKNVKQVVDVLMRGVMAPDDATRSDP